MNNTWYCVNTEFYDNGEVKACVAERQAKEKPNNQFIRNYRLTAFKVWLANKERAIEITRLIKKGEIHIDDLVEFYEGCLLIERRAA